MPQDCHRFHKIKKYCEVCDKKLVLNNNRDLKRKRFCSRICFAKSVLGTLGMKWGQETREKMRQSKINLLKTGWRPIGWKKYLPKIRISGRGYVMRGGKREHQLIMENLLGRKLNRGEVIHHKNLDKTDNRIENLKLMTRSEHIKLHLKLRILQCQKVLKIA